MDNTGMLGLPPILIVDDEKNMRLSLESLLGYEGYACKSVGSAEEAEGLLERDKFLMVILDARLPGMSGYEFLSRIRTQRRDLPVLMITAYATPKLAVEAVKAGAMDYLAKPFAPEELLHAIARCAERHRLLQENALLGAKKPVVGSLEAIVGESGHAKELRNSLRDYARSRAPVLIVGETGTGKELVAGALHGQSMRSDGPFVVLNCAAIPGELLESELFGHEKGAFTGAMQRKVGRVESANEGTLFLDEVGEMGVHLQAKLLRFLENRSFVRVGGTDELRVDVRVVAATNCDIANEIRRERFRKDLYYRLNTIHVTLLPLRQRREDIPLLAEHFLKELSFEMGREKPSLDGSAIEKLLQHPFPGNVRELKNVIEHALIVCKDRRIRSEHLVFVPSELDPPATRGSSDLVVPDDRSSVVRLDERVAATVRETLARSNGVVARAARELGISRQALYRIIEKTRGRS